MEKMGNTGRRKLFLAVALSLGILIAGCGSGATNPSVTEGMAAVEALDYQDRKSVV